MPYYVFAWIALLFFGFETIVSKLTSRYAVNNPWLFNFLWRLSIAVIIGLVAMVNSASLPSNWTNIALAALFTSVFTVCYVYTLYRVDVSVFSPLYNFRTAFSALFAALLIGEILTPWQYILVVIIFAAGLFVSIDEQLNIKSFFQSPILVFLLGLVALALSSIYIKSAIAEDGYWTATGWIYLLVPIFLLVTLPKFKQSLVAVKAKQASSIFLASLCMAIGLLAANRAYQSNVAISTAIMSIPISMIFAFLLSLIAPRLLEKHSLKVYAIRFGAAAIMIISALQLSH